jgi:hypothetical protein
MACLLSQSFGVSVFRNSSPGPTPHRHVCSVSAATDIGATSLHSRSTCLLQLWGQPLQAPWATAVAHTSKPCFEQNMAMQQLGLPHVHYDIYYRLCILLHLQCQLAFGPKHGPRTGSSMLGLHVLHGCCICS